MKKQRRFTTDMDIQMEIAKLRLNLKQCLIKADEHSACDKNNLAEANKPGLKAHERQFFLESSIENRLRAVRLRRRAELIEEVHIPAMVRTLASFQTKTMPFITEPGVVLSK
jgi:hypothetical protein